MTEVVLVLMAVVLCYEVIALAMLEARVEQLEEQDFADFDEDES